jgi:hypothetical protein
MKANSHEMPCSAVMIVLLFAQEGSWISVLVWVVILKQVCCINFRNIIGPSLQSPEPDGLADLWNPIWMLYQDHYSALWAICLCFRDVKLEMGNGVLRVNLLHRWNNLLILLEFTRIFRRVIWKVRVIRNNKIDSVYSSSFSKCVCMWYCMFSRTAWSRWAPVLLHASENVVFWSLSNYTLT